jgi:uncharacterized protein (DUF1778 family)
MRSIAHKSGTSRSRKNATGRIEARVLPEQKSLFERAAALRGVSLKAFMVGAMHEAAVQTLEQHESINLTIEERKIFIDALLNPPAPNEALRSATRRYNKMVSR